MVLRQNILLLLCDIYHKHVTSALYQILLYQVLRTWAAAAAAAASFLVVPTLVLNGDVEEE